MTHPKPPGALSGGGPCRRARALAPTSPALLAGRLQGDRRNSQALRNAVREARAGQAVILDAWGCLVPLCFKPV